MGSDPVRSRGLKGLASALDRDDRNKDQNHIRRVEDIFVLPPSCMLFSSPETLINHYVVGGIFVLKMI